MKTGRILVVDDEASVQRSIVRALERSGHELRTAGSAEDALLLLARESFDLVLCDIRLPGIDGLTLQERCRGDYPDLPFVMITAYAEVETAVRALKQGAYDYLTKPFSSEQLRKAAWRALEARWLRLENDSLHEVTRRRPVPERFLSPTMRRLYEDALRVAPSRAAVFISGESGCGKEVLAHFLHDNSERRDRIFLPVNCAALPESLADSNLFGHVRGAFTGAVSDRKGFLELADGGTLFLDEIEELKADVQAKLLRVLEDGKVRRVGSEREKTVDVRFLAAAQGDPERLVEDGRLREDLFFRLGAIQLRVPPLRCRLEDLAPLALHFLEVFSDELKKPIEGLDPEAAAALGAHSWPGNVRELRNIMERASIYVRPGRRVTIAELPKKFRGRSVQHTFSIEDATPPTLDELSRRYTEHVLRLSGGNRTRAARALGVSPSTLWRWSRRSKKGQEG